MTPGKIMPLQDSAKVFKKGYLNSSESSQSLLSTFAFNVRITNGFDIACQDHMDRDGDDDKDDDKDGDDDDDDDDDEYDGEVDDDDNEPYGEVGFEYEPGTYWDYGDDDDDED
ncbi:hypothetical protein BG003_003341 [Podila horticola]|nr:hypothetical protein BG003_003341 [Podila horticola]